jgi:O-antigen/teichoic acid export membrane protein
MSSARLSEQMVARNFLKLGSGEIFTRLITFIATIYVARVLGPESYGIVGFALAVTLYLSWFTDFGIELLAPREIAREPERMRDLAPSLVAARTLIAITCAVCMVVFSMLFLPEPDATVFAVCGLTLLPVGLGIRWVFYGMEKMGSVAIARTLGELLRLALVVLLVTGAADVARVPLAQFVGEMFAALLLLRWARQFGFRLTWRIDWEQIFSVFRRARSLMLTAVLGLVIYNVCLVILRFFRDVEEVGLYLAAYTLISLLANLGHAYSCSLLPTMSRLDLSEGHAQSLYDTGLAHMFAFVLPVAVGGCWFAQSIIELAFGDSYQQSGALLQVLIWCVPFLLTWGVLRSALIVRGHEDQIFRITAFTALLTIILNLVAVPVWGMLGAAVTAVIVEATRMLLGYRYVRNAGYHGTGLHRFWRSIVATTAMLAALYLLPTDNLWFGLITGIVVFILVLFLTGGLRLQRNGLPQLTI